MDRLLDPAAGLELVATFGARLREPEPRCRRSSTRPRSRGAVRLGHAAPRSRDLQGARGVRRPGHHVRRRAHETVLHGDGAGVLAAAAAGLLDPGTSRCSPAPSSPRGRPRGTPPRGRRRPPHRHRHEPQAGAALHVAAREHRRDEAADGTPALGHRHRRAASELHRSDDASSRSSSCSARASIDASAYGNVVSLFPEDRPDQRVRRRPAHVVALSTSRGFVRCRSDNDRHLSDRPRPDGRRPTTSTSCSRQPAGHASRSRSFDVVARRHRVFPLTVDPAAAFAPAGTRVDARRQAVLDPRGADPRRDYEGPVGDRRGDHPRRAGRGDGPTAPHARRARPE